MGDIYGDMTEDLDFSTIENPYYGDDMESEGPSISQHGNGHDKKNTESITTTTNIYYDMDDTELSGPHTSIVTATQNVYYGL